MNPPDTSDCTQQPEATKGSNSGNGALLAFIGGFIGGFSRNIWDWASALSHEFSLLLTIFFSAILAVLLYFGLKRFAGGIFR